MAKYGIPYMGSKSKIIDQFAHLFPKANHFYDLFGGGFSVSHYMIQRRSKDYKGFHFNEIRPGVCELVQRAISGEFNYQNFKMPWVSKEEFLENKDTDAFIKMVWSFGNNGNDYLFGEDIEPYKRSLHRCVVFDEFDEISIAVTGRDSWPPNTSIYKKRIFILNRVEWFRRTKKIPEQIQPFLKDWDGKKELKRLEQLERLERLQRLKQLQQLHFYNSDYRQIKINPQSIVYCDIPYKGTVEYDQSFNHQEFYDWADSQESPVFVSEYEIKDTRFKLIKEMKVKSSLGGQKDATERLYITKRFADVLL